VERVVGGLLARGRLSLEEGLALRQDLARSVHSIVAEAQTGTVAKVRSLFDRRPRRSPLAVLKGRLEALDASLGKRGSVPRGIKRPSARARKQSSR
jgi:polyhydroxyalkanoate synthesis regulator phasin